jgi:hypothetical protein
MTYDYVIDPDGNMIPTSPRAKMVPLDADGNPVGDPIPVRSFSFTRVDDPEPDPRPVTIHPNGSISGYLTAPGGFCAPVTPVYDPFVRLSQRHPEFFGKPKVDPDEDVPLFNRMPDAAKSDEFVFGSDEWKAQQRSLLGPRDEEEYARAQHIADVRRARMERQAEAENRDVDRLLYEMEHLERDMREEDRQRAYAKVTRLDLGKMDLPWEMARNDFQIFYESFSGIMDVNAASLLNFPDCDITDRGTNRAAGA